MKPRMNLTPPIIAPFVKGDAECAEVLTAVLRWTWDKKESRVREAYKAALTEGFVKGEEDSEEAAPQF